MKRKIYVASSWRNGYYPDVVVKLREAGHDVYMSLTYMSLTCPLTYLSLSHLLLCAILSVFFDLTSTDLMRI